MTHGHSGLSRRRFLGAAASGVALLAAGPIVRQASAGNRRQTVAVFGGGIAGLTAAHELALRGFDVTVFERREWGGKARSVDVAGSGTAGRRPLPGEHGFRIVFGFYRNLPDTLERIPFGSNPRGVRDNLVGVPQFTFARQGRGDLVLPFHADARAVTPRQVRELLLASLSLRLPPASALRLTNRLMVFFSSCDARRAGQWDLVPWTKFIGSDRYGGDYRALISEFPTHMLQASRANRTSSENVGLCLEQLIYGTADLPKGVPILQVLDAPTNEAWIDPWIVELARLGVSFRRPESVEALTLSDGRIRSASVRDSTGTVHEVVADWYVSALPVERAGHLWSDSILAAAPELARMSHLESAWMNGIQFYLREEPPLPRGHIGCLDSPWEVSGVSQAQFWKKAFGRTYGDGRAKACLSAVASDWTVPGVLYGRPARDLEPDQVAAEIWEQFKRHVNDTGEELLTDDNLLSWHLDPGLLRRPDGGFDNIDPLTIPTIGSLGLRPDAGTAIPNLILAGDQIKTDWWVATMEGANASGRLAANAILERSGSRESPVPFFPHYRPREWEPLKRVDALRYRAGQPNAFEVDAV